MLVSGGLDSAMLAAEYLAKGWEVTPFFVRSGLCWEKAEFFWLQRLLRTLKHPRLKKLVVAEAPMDGIFGRHWSVSGKGTPAWGSPWERDYLPGRNLVLLAHAGIFSGLNGIPLLALGILKGNPFSDATPVFIRSMQKTINLAMGTRVKIAFPYARLTKAEILRRVPGFPVRLTFSCLKPAGRAHCGKCEKCGERAGVI